MKPLSFKMRITLFTGIIVLITSLSLTLVSMYNARKQIKVVISNNTSAADAANSDVVYSVNSSVELDAETDISFSEAENTDVVHYTINAERASRSFNIISIIAMLITAAAGMIFAYIFAGRSLKPIRELNDTTMRITEKDLNMRLPERGSNDEISSLTNSFNSMLDRLSDAFESQKQFSSNAAHELKTPVAIMKAGLQTLEIDENSTSEDYREVFSIISRNLNRLADIVDDLLLLTNKSSSFECDNISLNDMLMRIAEDLSLKYIGIRIEYNFDGEHFIKCPETLAHRLFCNLIENAFKYNRPDGSIIIFLTAAENGCIARIKDSGIGIPIQELDNIWNAFYCVDSSRSKKLGGVGLGLSLVKEIAACLNWKILVLSDENGSEFTVECYDI